MANEKRVRRGFVLGTLGASLTDSGMTITFATAPPFAGLAGDEHIALVLDPEGTAGDPEIVYVTAYTSAATTATIARGQEGTTARGHDNGVPWLHGPTLRDQSAGRVAWAERTAGNVNITSTSPATVDTGTDLTVAAQEGDVLEVMPGFFTGAAGAPSMSTDFRTVVDGTETNYFSSGTSTQRSDGISAFFIRPGGFGASGSFFYRVQAADVHEGTVTVRWKAWVSSSDKLIVATSDNPARVQLRNLGPQEA